MNETDESNQDKPLNELSLLKIHFNKAHDILILRYNQTKFISEEIKKTNPNKKGSPPLLSNYLTLNPEKEKYSHSRLTTFKEVVKEMDILISKDFRKTWNELSQEFDDNPDDELPQDPDPKPVEIEKPKSQNNKMLVLWQWIKLTYYKRKNWVVVILFFFLSLNIASNIWFQIHYYYESRSNSFWPRRYQKPFIVFNNLNSDLPILRVTRINGSQPDFYDTLYWHKNTTLGVGDTLAVDIHYHNVGNITGHNVFIKLSFTPDLNYHTYTSYITAEIIHNNINLSAQQLSFTNIRYVNVSTLEFDSTYFDWHIRYNEYLPKLPYHQNLSNILTSGINLGDIPAGEEGDAVFYFIVRKNDPQKRN